MKITPARARWFGRLGALVLRVLGATWRIRTQGATLPADDQVIFAFLHGDMLVPAHRYRRRNAAIMISQHGDGEVIAQIVERLGFVPVRGSSTRGGMRALLEMLRDHAERPLAITPDGPRGPRGTVHQGVIQLAAATGRPIYAASYAVSRGKRLGSWDRFVIPAPFAHIVEHLAEPLRVPGDVDEAQRAQLASELEARFRAGEAAAVQTVR